MEKTEIEKYLQTRDFGRNLVCLDTTESTNLDAKMAAANGCAHGYTVVADEQTAGRGRLDHAWMSPSGINIYVSIVLKPRTAPSSFPQIPVICAIALHQALAGMAPSGGFGIVEMVEDIVGAQINQLAAEGVAVVEFALREERLGFAEHDETVRMGQIEHEALKRRVLRNVVADDQLFENIVRDRVHDLVMLVMEDIRRGRDRRAFDGAAFVVFLPRERIRKNVERVYKFLEFLCFRKIATEQVRMAQLNLTVIGLLDFLALPWLIVTLKALPNCALVKRFNAWSWLPTAHRTGSLLSE